MDGPYDSSLRSIEQAIEQLRLDKPQNKSETDRAFAITITELEKALAYFKVFVVQNVNDNPF